MSNRKARRSATADAALATRLCHSPYQAPQGFASFAPATERASTVLFENCAQMRATTWQDKSTYTYGLHGTPTTFTLEARLCEIEGAKHCLLAPSGLAAIALINFALLKSGDDLLIPDNVYSPNRDIARWLAREHGISVRVYAPGIGAGIAALIQDNTRLIWTEAPGSITMEIPDLPAICAAAQARGVPVALDNTWSAGIAYDGFKHGADIIMQALTKYQAGASDLLMGAVLTRDAKLAQKLDICHMRLGYGVGADDAYLILRNLPHLKLRFEAQDRAARELAAWLQTRPEVAQVLHPALPESPDHALWRRDFSGAASLFSLIFQPHYSSAQIDAVADALEYFGIGFSWGGAHSLCMPYDIKQMRDAWPHAGCLLRLYVGLEEVADLRADLERAFALALR
ncbi:cystathionine beta-lyase [Massilia sp. W12]|uniref:cystathionine beta-lyase n=1 Tax=Massilia sp. W12 TaxID=3126507 RepID=UPI0030CF1B6A